MSEDPVIESDGEGERFWDRAMSHVFGGAETAAVEEVVEAPGDLRCGRYRLIDEIARGGIGVIYLARDEDLRRDVAVKVLRQRYGENEGMIQRFLEEAQICGQLQHPGIVPVYEVGLSSVGRPYFSMKLVEGQDFAELLADREEPREERGRFLSIFEQICQTLAFAHDRAVIHRDLKPNNVMVGAFGEVQVVDWGFAKVLGARGRFVGDKEPKHLETIRSAPSADGTGSQAGAVLGTPLYMPPEQARGNVTTLDARADVFALGAILCEILTGWPPYRSDDADPLVMAADASLEGAHRMLAECDADEELVRLATWCLEPSRENRPRNAGVLSASMVSYLAGIERRNHQTQMAAAEARGRADEQGRSHRLAVALTLLILVSVVLGGSIVFAFDVASRQRREANAQQVRKGLAAATAFMDAGELEDARAALERARAALGRGPVEPAVRDEVVAATGDLERLVWSRAARERHRARQENLERGLAELRSAPQSGELLGRYRDVLGELLPEPGSSLERLVPVVRALDAGDAEAVVRGVESWALLATRCEDPQAAALWSVLSSLTDEDTRGEVHRALAANDVARLEVMAALPRRFAPWVATLVARGLESAGRTDEALRLLERTHETYPGDVAVNRGLALLLGGRVIVGERGVRPARWGDVTERARTHAGYALVGGDEAFAREHFAALVEASDPERAARLLQPLLAREPRPRRVLLHLARIRLREGREPAARQLAAEALANVGAAVTATLVALRRDLRDGPR